MLAQQLNVEVISNNIANMNTTGYKRQRAEFQDLLYQSLERVGADSSDAGTIVPSGIQVGVGVKAGAVYRISDQGDLTITNNNYDLAIDGQGFFRIQMPSGEDAYTRAGSFQVGPDGQIVTMEGYTVGPGIAVPEGTRDIAINEMGQVQAVIDGDPAPQTVGQLELATFLNPAGLEAIGDNLLLETAASGSANTGVPGAAGFGRIMQGFLEMSNVNAVQEVTALIQAQRAYEMNSKVITASDEMMRAAANVR